jgi:protein involved in polysaccharide export with SLBB domain
MSPHARRSITTLLAVLAMMALQACSSTSPDKRLLQYLNDKGFGNRYTGNAEDQNYVTIGDTIAIQDAYHDELDQTQRVDIDGTVILPEIGAVHVAGQTRSELEAFLTQKYTPYYEQLKISVRLTTGGKFYFIFGEVLAEGKKPFPGDLTVLEAVSEAGHDPRTANLGRVKVIRADPRDPLVIDVNLRSIFKTGDSTDNLIIQERDIIYVPPTMIAEFGYFLADLMFPITTVINQIAGAFYWFDGNYGYGGRGRYYGNNQNGGGFP